MAKFRISVRNKSEEKVIETSEFNDAHAAIRAMRDRGWMVDEIVDAADPVATMAPPPNIRLTNADAFAGQADAEEIGLVTAECVFGAGPIKNIALGVRNAFGGRSEGMQRVFREARDSVLADLKREAAAVGADGVVACDLRYEAIQADGEIMQMAYAVGTAVRFRPAG